ncbi:ubiquitin supergroup [Purpureocillium lilacinum]|uniref:Ubiquitin supergroup n=1 Tax=Purpureocillium lilacinum TaxID=33203 RepID=A0A179HG69_PURLI|nr:ubiquitin supergroup [Purpureocillium lilacinum]OAQ88473.1 ubiquitin supergroup [Purpureocillium lilacinum]
MTEVAFARTFLSSLDSRPVKLSPDHVEDPKNFPARPPYILPRMPQAMSQPKSLAPGQERSITVTLKSLRNPPLDIKLTSQPLATSLLDIKNAVSSQTRIPVDKMKILYNKRPLTDSKILKEVVGENDKAVEFSVMVIGGSAAIPPEQPATTAPAEATGTAAVETDAFWADLKGYLMQRLKDQAAAEELSRLFKSSWESSKSAP